MGRRGEHMVLQDQKGCGLKGVCTVWEGNPFTKRRASAKCEGNCSNCCQGWRTGECHFFCVPPPPWLHRQELDQGALPDLPRPQVESSSVACSQDSTCPAPTMDSSQTTKTLQCGLSLRLLETHTNSSSSSHSSIACSQDFPQSETTPTIGPASQARWQ